MERATAEVISKIRELAEHADAPDLPDITQLSDDELVYTLQMRWNRRASAVPEALLDEYERARFAERFPPAHPQILARARAVKISRLFGLSY